MVARHVRTILVSFFVLLAFAALGVSITWQRERSRQVSRMPEIVNEYSFENIEKALRVESTVYLERESFNRYVPKATKTLIVGNPDPDRKGKMQSISAFVEIPGSNVLYGSEISDKPKGYMPYYYVLDRYVINKQEGTLRMIWKAQGYYEPLVAGGLIIFVCLAFVLIIRYGKTSTNSSDEKGDDPKV